MARIENHKFTITDAFKECFYVVPDYQREFVWTEKQVGQLLEDIDEQLDSSSSEYFIGTVLVSPRNDKGHFDVIDGQQRLTTAFLILCALRVLFQGSEHGEMINRLLKSSYVDRRGDIKTDLKLDPRYENAETVMEKIVQANGDPQAVQVSIRDAGIQIYGSVENILNAYHVIFRFLTDNYDDSGKLKQYYRHLAHDVVFIQISTDVSSALKIFETINERGVGLNPMDLLKNLLFAQVAPSEFSRLKDDWKKITSPLEKSKEKPLRFLRYFLMANYKIQNARRDDIVREDEIYDWFSRQENAEATGYKKNPIEFVRHITRNVDRYIDFGKGLGNDGGPSHALDVLKKLTGSAFSLHYVLLLPASKLPISLFEQFVAQIESFLFFHIFTKTQSKYLERNFSIWADEIRDIIRLDNPEKQVESLNEFVNKRFSRSMDEKSDQLQDALRRLTLHSMPKYRIRYFLARLTEHVDMAYSGAQKRGDLSSYFNLEIEHILPNNPDSSDRDNWQNRNLETPYDEYKDRLGNLTLLEKPINIVVGNKVFTEKAHHYDDSAHYLTRSLYKQNVVGEGTSIIRINEKLSSFEKWDAEDIEKRQSLIIELARDVWKATHITP